MADQLCLNLGCGDRPEKGWINHDRQRYHPKVDVAWELEQLPWPAIIVSRL